MVYLLYISAQKPFLKEVSKLTKKVNYYLLQTDDNYAAHSLVTILSIQEHTKETCKNVFYIIDDHIKEETKSFMQEFSVRFSNEIRFLDMSDVKSVLEKSDIPTWRGGYTAYLKMFAMDKIEDADRVLYLDSDIIVRGDLSPVFSYLDGTDAPLAMVEDMTVSTRYDFKEYVFGSSDKSLLYYNVGSILFDIKRWKEQKCNEQLWSFIKSNKRDFMYWEQEVFNLVFKGNIQTLPPEYNYCTPLLFFGAKTMGKLFYWDEERVKEYEALKDRYLVGHCFAVFSRRPWHEKSKHPLADEYKRLYEKIYGRPHVGVPIKLGIKEKLQSVLYYVCKPLYCSMHRMFTNRFYRSFLEKAQSK